MELESLHRLELVQLEAFLDAQVCQYRLAGIRAISCSCVPCAHAYQCACSRPGYKDSTVGVVYVQVQAGKAAPLKDASAFRRKRESLYNTAF
jgi:hypothetical protein